MNMQLDSHVLCHLGPLALNMTLVMTWIVMAVAAGLSWLVTRHLVVEHPSHAQVFLEAVVGTIHGQVAEIVEEEPGPILPFVGTLFVFISLSSLLSVVPGFHPPTGSLSTTGALALCVFVAVPLFGIARQGLAGYLKTYLEPTLFMLPFHVMSELTRTLSLAVRLFGNVMSGTLMGGVLLSLTPLLFPVVMQAFELLIGQVQAYIFAVLATVYLASARRVRRQGGRT